MCLDGTCELGTDVLFSLFDELSGLVLVTGRMKGENTAEIKALVDRCIKLFGMPLATVRDLSNDIRLDSTEWHYLKLLKVDSCSWFPAPRRRKINNFQALKSVPFEAIT